MLTHDSLSPLGFLVPTDNHHSSLVACSGDPLALQQRIEALEHAVRDRDRRLEALLSNTSECVLVLRRNGEILEANGVALQLFQEEYVNFVGQCIYDRVAPEDVGSFRTHHDEVCHGQRTTCRLEIIAR